MRFSLPEPHILEEGGFTAENDIFMYREFGERLANLVSNISNPLVVTLDGSWGSGKSVFIKQWAGLMRERGGSVVYFDAFGNESEDALEKTIKEKLQKTGEERLLPESFRKALEDVSKAITKKKSNHLSR